MMSTYEQPLEVKPQAPVGVFEPSRELLERFRGLLASSPPTSRRSSAFTLIVSEISCTMGNIC